MSSKRPGRKSRRASARERIDGQSALTAQFTKTLQIASLTALACLSACIGSSRGHDATQDQPSLGCATGPPAHQLASANGPDELADLTLVATLADGRIIALDTDGRSYRPLARMTPKLTHPRLAFDSRRDILYVVAGQPEELHALDVCTGEAKRVGPITIAGAALDFIGDVAYEPRSDLLLLSGSVDGDRWRAETLLSLEPVSARATVLSTVGPTEHGGDLDILETYAGELIGVDVVPGSSHAYTVSLDTGATVSVGRSEEYIARLAIHPGTGATYGTNFNTGQLYRVERSPYGGVALGPASGLVHTSLAFARVRCDESKKLGHL